MTRDDDVWDDLNACDDNNVMEIINVKEWRCCGSYEEEIAFLCDHKSCHDFAKTFDERQQKSLLGKLSGCFVRKDDDDDGDVFACMLSTDEWHDEEELVVVVVVFVAFERLFHWIDDDHAFYPIFLLLNFFSFDNWFVVLIFLYFSSSSFSSSFWLFCMFLRSLIIKYSFPFVVSLHCLRVLRCCWLFHVWVLSFLHVVCHLISFDSIVVYYVMNFMTALKA